MKHVVFAVLAGVLWGVGEVCTRSALHSGRVGPISAITVRSLVAIPVVLAVFFLMTRGVAGLKAEPALQAINGVNWLKIVLGSGLVAGGLAMVCFYIALSLGEVSVVKPIAFSIAPAVGVVLGWLVLGEELSARKVLAVALIVAGVVILTTGGGKRVAPPAANETGPQTPPPSPIGTR
jgi:uncharacterized membrane protein